jgi:hypothetical protein
VATLIGLAVPAALIGPASAFDLLNTFGLFGRTEEAEPVSA